jgi:hypothetical protein
MVQGISMSEDERVRAASPLVKWLEYAEIPRFGDYDGPVGDELSVPIIYEPG